jgi:hypothetical protein
MPAAIDIDDVNLYGFTPIFVNFTGFTTNPSLKVQEWDGAAYQDILELQGENDGGNAYFNISALPLFDILDGLPTFGSHTTVTGLVRKIKTLGYSNGADDEDVSEEAWAIHGAYPPTLDFSDYGKTKFLSHQPRNQDIYDEQPFWLYYFVYLDDTDIELHVQATYADGSTVSANSSSVNYDKGDMIAFDVATYKDLVSETDLTKIKVWLSVTENEGGETNFDTEAFTLTLRDDEPDWNTQYFLFFDKFGAMVTLPCRGKRTKTLSENRTYASRPMGRTYNTAKHTKVQSNRNVRTFSSSTGWLEDAEYYQALFDSERVWLIDTENDRFIAVNIETPSPSYKEDFENIIHIEFEYTFQEQNYYHPEWNS